MVRSQDFEITVSQEEQRTVFVCINLIATQLSGLCNLEENLERTQQTRTNPKCILLHSCGIQAQGLKSKQTHLSTILFL